MIVHSPADNDLTLLLWRNCYCCRFMFCLCFVLSFQHGHLRFVFFSSEPTYFPGQVKTWEQCHTPCAQGLSHMQFTHTHSENRQILVTLSPSTCQNRWVMSKVGTPRLCSRQINLTQSFCALSSSPLLPGHNQDVVEEEEVDLLPWRPLEEDATVFHKGCQLSSLHHPPGGWD